MGNIEKPGAGWSQDSEQLQGSGENQGHFIRMLTTSLELLELQCRPLSIIFPSHF